MDHHQLPIIPPRLSSAPPGFHPSHQNVISSSMQTPQAQNAFHSASTPMQHVQHLPSWDSGFASPDLFASSRRPISHVNSVPAQNNSVLCNIPAENSNVHCLQQGRANSNSAHMYHSAHFAPCLSSFYAPSRVHSAPPGSNVSFEQLRNAPAHSNQLYEVHTPVTTSSSSGSNPFLRNSNCVLPPSEVAPAAMSGHSSQPTTSSEADDTARLRSYARLPSLPEFQEKRPEFWFKLIENVFNHLRLDQDSRFVCLMNSLARYENLISDLLTWPESPERYERAKDTILYRLGRTTEDGIRQILGTERMGKSSPSQMWRRLRDIAPPHVLSDAALRVIWLDKLPPYVSLQISNAPPMALEPTLESADRVYDNFKRIGGAQGIQTHDPSYPGRPFPAGRGRGRGRGKNSSGQDSAVAPGKKNSSNQGGQSTKKIQYIDDMPLRMPPENPEWCSEEDSSPPDMPPLPSSPPLSRELPLSHQLCHYHYHFGASAKKCRPPCNHPNARRC